MEKRECVVCLERLDDPEFGPAQRLAAPPFHRACVEELQRGRAAGVSDVPREAAGQRGEDVRRRGTIYVPIVRRVTA